MLQNNFLQKMLKLGSWNFNKLLLSVWADICILNMFQEVLTFVIEQLEIKTQKF